MQTGSGMKTAACHAGETHIPALSVQRKVSALAVTSAKRLLLGLSEGD